MDYQNSPDPFMAPMRIFDASSILRKSINQNERPYTKAVLKYNNSIVDEWHEKVLVNIATRTGNIRAGQVWTEWQFFYNGKLTFPYMKAFEDGYISRPNPSAVDFWVDKFMNSTIEELVEMGPSAVGHGWKLVSDESSIRKTLERWELVYKHSNEPLEWRKKAHDNPKLWATEYDNVFWSEEQNKDITQKVFSVLKTSIAPKTTENLGDNIRVSDASDLLRRYIGGNELPYTKAVLKNNNSLVDEWHYKVLINIASREGEILTSQYREEWLFFYTGKIITPFIKALENGHVSRPDEKSVNYWKNIFQDSTIEELIKMGPAVVEHGWKLIADESYIRKSLEKWELIYKGSDDPMVWRERSHANAKLWFTEHDDAFWDVDQYRDITQKVFTVLKTVIEPSK